MLCNDSLAVTRAPCSLPQRATHKQWCVCTVLQEESGCCAQMCLYNFIMQDFGCQKTGHWLPHVCCAPGNKCEAHAESRIPGNGRVIVAKLNSNRSIVNNGPGCVWQPLKTVKLPPTACFEDYSAISIFFNPLDGQSKGTALLPVAVTSQESSAVWIGTFDRASLEFSGPGKVYRFPLDDNVEVMYCNVEGVAWLDSRRLVFASDKPKSDL